MIVTSAITDRDRIRGEVSCEGVGSGRHPLGPGRKFEWDVDFLYFVALRACCTNSDHCHESHGCQEDDALPFHICSFLLLLRFLSIKVAPISQCHGQRILLAKLKSAVPAFSQGLSTAAAKASANVAS
jgi:hypothetical protein